MFAPEPVVKGFSPASHDAFQAVRTADQGQGRVEVRTLTVSHRLTGYSDWPHLAQVFRVPRRTIRPRTGEVRADVTSGITSLTPVEATAERLREVVRAHWRLENQLHYRRAASRHEDAGRLRTGHGAPVLAALNNLVLGLLTGLGDEHIRTAREHCDAHPEEAIGMLWSSAG